MDDTHMLHASNVFPFVTAGLHLSTNWWADIFTPALQEVTEVP